MTSGQMAAVVWLLGVLVLMLPQMLPLPRKISSFVEGLGVGMFLLGTVVCVWTASGLQLSIGF